MTQENPYEAFAKLYPVDTICDVKVVSKNEYALFVKVEDIDVEAFLHCNDLTFLNNGANFNISDEKVSNFLSNLDDNIMDANLP